MVRLQEPRACSKMVHETRASGAHASECACVYDGTAITATYAVMRRTGASHPIHCICCQLSPSPAGDFPWAEDAAHTAVTAAQRHYAQRYRHALAQHARSLEERSMLRAEFILLLNGLEEREHAIEEWKQQHAGGGADAGTHGNARATGGTAPTGGGGSGATGGGGDVRQWPSLLAAGEAALIDIELARLQLIHAQAIKLRKKYL